MNIRTSLLCGALVGAALLGGCASSSMSDPSNSMAGMSKADGDMTAMCDMHKKMMGSMSAQDQKAMMDEHMKDMTPEMRAKHMEKMKQCM